MGFWFAESVASQSATVVPVIQEMSSDSRKFTYFDLQRGLSNVTMLMVGNTPNFQALKNGYIIATSAEMADGQSLTAGTIDIEVTKGGVLIPNVALNLTINAATDPDRDRKTIPQTADFSFNADDLLGFEITTDGTMTPTGVEVSAFMFVYYL